MGKKAPCPQCPQCLPRWLVTFGDLMSLLLVFFILLLSMSSMDTKKVNEAIGSLAGAMSVLDGGKQTEVSIERIQEATPIEESTPTTQEVNRIEAVIAEVNEIIQSQGGQAVTLEEAEDGFIIQMPASLLFRPGSAVIENDDALLFIKRVALMITKMSANMDIVVRGHTDNLPLPSNSPYHDNWELSTARAVTVTKELIKNDVKPFRLSAAGHAEYRPITTNSTAEGRARNRRVELHFLSKNQGLQTQTAKSILDTVNE